MEDTARDLAVYILLRTDLPSLNSGKAAAQAHHSGVQMMVKHNQHSLVQEYISMGIKQGADCFNTTLVLAANYQQIEHTIDIAKVWNSNYLLYDGVVDPSYPFVVDEEISRLIPQTETTTIVKPLDNSKVLMVRKELTCAWFLIDRNDLETRKLFDGFNLHP